MTAKIQAAPSPDIVTKMEFKKQEEFFEAIYQYFKEYQEKYADFYTDAKAGIPAFKSIIKIISSAKAQISKVADMDEIEKSKEVILKLLRSNNQNNKAREELDKLSTIVFAAFEKIGISPTIHEEKDLISNFWKDEEHAGLKEMKKAFFDSFMLPEE